MEFVCSGLGGLFTTGKVFNFVDLCDETVTLNPFEFFYKKVLLILLILNFRNNFDMLFIKFTICLANFYRNMFFSLS